jgi:flavodoxin
MKLLIVYFSYPKGNKRLLANHLGERLGATVVQVKERRIAPTCVAFYDG